MRFVDIEYAVVGSSFQAAYHPSTRSWFGRRSHASVRQVWLTKCTARERIGSRGDEMAHSSPSLENTPISAWFLH